MEGRVPRAHADDMAIRRLQQVTDRPLEASYVTPHAEPSHLKRLGACVALLLLEQWLEYRDQLGVSSLHAPYFHTCHGASPERQSSSSRLRSRRVSIGCQNPVCR